MEQRTPNPVPISPERRRATASLRNPRSAQRLVTILVQRPCITRDRQRADAMPGIVSEQPGRGGSRVIQSTHTGQRVDQMPVHPFDRRQLMCGAVQHRDRLLVAPHQQVGNAQAAKPAARQSA